LIGLRERLKQQLQLILGHGLIWMGPRGNHGCHKFVLLVRRCPEQRRLK